MLKMNDVTNVLRFKSIIGWSFKIVVGRRVMVTTIKIPSNQVIDMAKITLN